MSYYFTPKKLEMSCTDYQCFIEVPSDNHIDLVWHWLCFYMIKKNP